MALVDRRTGAELARLRLDNNENLYPRRFSPDGSLLCVWGQQTNLLYVWDLRLLRQHLAASDLDWDLPSYPPPRVRAAGLPKVRFDLGKND